MKVFEKIERKLWKYAIKNLTVYILLGYAIGYILMFVAPSIYEYLVMDPAAIMRGQVWRLVTWVITPPQGLSIFTIFMFTFFYFIGTSLERCMGTFRYNVYIFSGIIFMIIGSMLTYFVISLIEPDMAKYVPVYISTYYINLTSFLAFAVYFPNYEVYYMFFIPLKIKWLAIIDLVLIALELIMVNPYTNSLGMTAEGQAYLYANFELFKNMSVWSQRVMIIVPLINFAIFFLFTRNLKRVSPSEIKRKHDFKKKMEAPARSNHPRHQCTICGRTEKDNDELVFRYCSKCSGNYEYCQDHIFTHEHK